MIVGARIVDMRGKLGGMKNRLLSTWLQLFLGLGELSGVADGGMVM